MDSIYDLLSFTESKLLQYLIVAVAILIVAFLLLKTLRLILNRYIRKSSEDLNVDPTQYKFLNNALGYIIYISAIVLIFMSIPDLKNLGL